MFCFSLFFRFWAVRYIKLVISSAFERTLIYRIIWYRIDFCAIQFVFIFVTMSVVVFTVSSKNDGLID